MVITPAEVRESHGAISDALDAPGPILAVPSPGPERCMHLADCALTLREAAARPEPEHRSMFKAGGMPLGFYGVGHGPGGVGKTRELLRAVVLRTLCKP